MERISRFRAILFLALFSFVLLLFAGRLFVMQIIESDGKNDNIQKYTTITTVRAGRGDILDRNGNVMVGNRASYDLVFNHYVANSYSDANNALYRLVKKCNELGIEYNDHFPISKTPPFEYTLYDFTSSWQGHFQSFMVDRGLDSDISAPLLLQRLRGRYKIPTDWTEEEARAVIGIRYEFDLRGITNLPTYTFLEDVSDENLATLLELNTPGLNVESSTVREYHTKYGAHVLGYLGGMNNDQWQVFKDQGYSMDAMVGQTGFEEAFEEYLHGIDGQRVDIVSKDGALIDSFWRVDKDENGNPVTLAPKAGNNVWTTLDINLQRVAEEAMAQRLEEIGNPEINKAEGEHQGHDVQGGAAIMIDCATGEVLVCASYPTYDLATMHENWKAIEEDPRKPFFNRAFGAEYPPGSTFKMSTLITAMENVSSKTGEILLKPGEQIEDKGWYDNPEMAGFNPTCLVYSQYKQHHGFIDAAKALEVSCNVFFYELGYRATWQMHAATAEALGMGTPTGIELLEKPGKLNTPDVKKAVYKNGINAKFSGGDRVLGAIGQAENRITPLQLCVYASTLANKGTRMKATFLSRVVSSDYRTLVLENEPKIAHELKLKPTTVEAYYTGMRNVIMGPQGTGRDCFGGAKDYPNEGDGRWPLAEEVEVFAKTGTAQHASGGSDHGAYVCFARRKGQEEPDVAIALFGEKAAHGNWLAPIAEKMLLAYYELIDASEVTAFENQPG